MDTLTDSLPHVVAALAALELDDRDGTFVDRLALLDPTEWDPAVARAAWEMAARHRTSLDRAGVDLDQVPVPPALPDFKVRFARKDVEIRTRDRARAASRRLDVDDTHFLLTAEWEPGLGDAVTRIPGRVWDRPANVNRIPLEQASRLQAVLDRWPFHLTPAAATVLEARRHATSPPPEIRVQLIRGALHLAFSFDRDLNAAAKTLPGVRFTRDPQPGWQVSTVHLDEVAAWLDGKRWRADELAEQAFTQARAERQMRLASTAEDADLPAELLARFARQPYAFQRAGIAYAMRARRTFIADEMGLGKGHPHGTRICTPSGWRMIQTIKPGDAVVGRRGQPVKVRQVHHRGVLDVFRVTFSDGASVTVDGDHLWQVNTPMRRWCGSADQVVATRDLALDLRTTVDNTKWFIPMVDPIKYDPVHLPVDPYLLGVLLGDGSLTKSTPRYTSVDPEIVAQVEARLPAGVEQVAATGAKPDYRLRGYGPRSAPNPLTEILRSLGVHGLRSWEKHIPAPYLHGSRDERLDLLRGLLDTDGWISGQTVGFSSASRQLAQDVRELVESLGGTARANIKTTVRRDAHTLTIAMPGEINPFSLPRKADQWRPRVKYQPSRGIVAIEPAGSSPVICLTLDDDERLYVTEHHIVTHNSGQALCTLEALDAFPALMVAPSSLTRNLAREAAAWIPQRSTQILDGTAQQMLYGDIILCSYDVLYAHAPVLARHRLAGFAMDESHYAKNPRARRTLACAEVADSLAPDAVRLLMTGTPFEKQRSEIKSQLRILGRYDEIGGDAAFRDLTSAEYNARMRSTCYVRRLKKDVLKDLPEKRWLPPIEVDPDPKLLDEYRRAERDIIAYVAQRARQIAVELAEATGAEVDPEAEAVAAALRAEAAKHLVAINHLKRIAARAKMPAVRSWVRQFTDSGQKVVLFGTNREIVDGLADEFDCPKITGDVTGQDRQAAVDRFQQDPDVTAIACSIRAAGVGLTLTAASDVAFVQFGWNPSEMDQAIDRCHRIGQAESVSGWRFIIPNSIDGWVLDLIDQKRVEVDALTEGGTGPGESSKVSVAGDLLVRLRDAGLSGGGL